MRALPINDRQRPRRGARVLRAKGGTLRIGISAPSDVIVDREAHRHSGSLGERVAIPGGMFHA